MLLFVQIVLLLSIQIERQTKKVQGVSFKYFFVSNYIYPDYIWYQYFILLMQSKSTLA